MPLPRTLPEISPFTYGTAKLNDPTHPEHVRLARRAMEAGVWFHSAREYGTTYETLRAAFDEAPAQRPPCIIKVHGEDAPGMLASVETALRDLGIDRVDLAQMCGLPSVERDLQPGCELHDAMCELVEQGKVGAYVQEFFRPSTAESIASVRAGLFPGYVFYYNVIDREVSNALFDEIVSRGAGILSLRTVGGGPGQTGYVGERSDAMRAAMSEAIADLSRRAGCDGEIEFRLRFPLSVDNVATTIGATDKADHLERFLSLNASADPLPPDVVQTVQDLHRQWFAE